METTTQPAVVEEPKTPETLPTTQPEVSTAKTNKFLAAAACGIAVIGLGFLVNHLRNEAKKQNTPELTEIEE